ncbi:General stress protein 16U [Paenibacillus nuruki]|uniref:General stress protein 16U n=1 Tax=Paenibacillus nuruki TaxID=1886670 RepID=A0A1E3KX74_9BACL|nr:TerD family protein [Paenibacillus nuruki]ODP26152.1 General stress protein 16U [Paenibacillus nuruki]
MIISKGQKIDVTKGNSVAKVAVGLRWESNDPTLDINVSAFLLDQQGRCNADEDMIFYNQPLSRNQAVSHVEKRHDDRESIDITFSSLPKDIAKIAITLTIHEGEALGQSFVNVKNAECRIYLNEKEEYAVFPFGEGLNQETAIVVGELYMHQNEWKFNAISSGYTGGLSALVQSFGLSLESEAEEPVTPIQAPIAPMILDLQKKQSINIVKSTKVTATLEWDSKKDLDLYCFYVTKQGETGKIYYRNLGSATESPYISLDGDAGANGKETIVIHRPEELHYVLIAAYSAISNGVGSFKSMKAKAVVDNHQGQIITSPLYENNMFAYWVAIAKIDFTAPNEMSIIQIEEYSKAGVEKSPLLYEDGSFKMNVGPAEFKRKKKK